MLFNSIDFLLFFPVVVLIYYVIPRRFRYIWLLVASYWFYMSWNPRYALLMLFSTAVTWVGAMFIGRVRGAGRGVVLALCAIANLGVLCLFKYANFLLESLEMALHVAGIARPVPHVDLLLPVGISFFTFQSLSYVIDVYRGRIRAERSFLRYALFVSFFPQLVAGPIERSGNLLPQLRAIERLDLGRESDIRDGAMMMSWGYFQKLVIADRTAILVNRVFDSYTEYGAIEIIIALLLFAIQLYCDFGGYSNIARGAARVMGIHLMHNFRQPYLAKGFRDFWRRWHVSLTSWFTDYLYIPLGGSRKGVFRKYLNIMIVFAVSGLWHGAEWSFVGWGVLNGLYRLVEDGIEAVSRFFRNITGPQAQNDRKIRPQGADRQAEEPKGTVSRRVRSAAAVFACYALSLVFFRAETIGDAVGMLQQATVSVARKSVLELGYNRWDWSILLIAIGILLTVDVAHERGIAIFRWVDRQEAWLRWSLYLGLVWTTILFGIYGPKYAAGEFIYFRF